MKKLLVFVVAVLSAAAAGAAGADAQKGGPATVLDGGRGVVAPDGKTRYITLSTGRQTIVSFVRLPSGQVHRWRLLRGYFGVPVVGVDGTTDGITHDGRTLVLASLFDGKRTQFALVDTKTLRLRMIALRGNWSYDAISPDGSLLYLIQYRGVGTNPSYRVRAYDVAARRLFARPVVDADIGERLMFGWSVTRQTSSSGRWAYTVYARQKHEPFVHALDTTSRRALCIELPLDMKRPEQMSLRLRLREDRMLEVRRGSRTVAAVDTRTFVVRKH